MAYSSHLLCALFALFLIVSGGVLVYGQVGNCTGTGCSCTGMYTCCLMVQEEELNGSVVGPATIGFTITGTEPEFSITTTDVPFVISDSNADTGLITTTEKIDRESAGVGSCISLTVRLSQSINGQVNSAGELFAVEIVDINDNDPQFSQEEYTFSVAETKPGELMKELVCSGDLQATDADDSTNGQVFYSVSGSDYFAVTNNGVPCILNTRELDRETDESLSFTLVATDGGGRSDSATVTMVLLDINDNAPTLADSYVFHVPEDREVNSILDPPIQAFDADDGSNAEIRYEIQMPDDFQFQINSSSGVLTLISSLDYEDIAQDPVISFTVRATNMGNSPPHNETQVIIMVEDVNERAEITFTSRPVDNRDSIVEEDIREDPILAFTLTERDSDANRNNTIVFLSGGEYFIFRSGSIDLQGTLVFSFSIIQNVSIDREENREVRSTLELSFMLVEGGSPEITTNFNYTIDIVDINDNSPELSQTQFQIVENNEAFERIAALASVAFDLDNGGNGSVESYRLVSVMSPSEDDLTDRFLDVNDNFPTNGRLLAPGGLDREVDGPSLTITVELSDGGEPPLSVSRTIMVDILDENDNVPVFDNVSYTFTLRENSDAGSIVGSVSATDSDDEGENAVIYSLAEPSEDFQIDTNSGQITSLKELDREEADSFTIRVIANNTTPIEVTGLSSEVSVTIQIEDVNDNPPLLNDNSQRSFSVSSDARVGTTVGRLMATDADIGENGKVHYRLDISDFFAIGKLTGIINTTRALNGPETINLTVTADNPVEVTQQSQFEITIEITESDAESNMAYALIVGSLAGVIIIIVTVIAVVAVLLCWRGKRIGKLRFHSTNPDALNNGRPPSPKSILRHVPSIQRGGLARGVTFGGTVKKTVYDDSETVASDPSVYQVNSSINFGSSDESPITPPRSHINGTIPSEGLPLSNGVLCSQRTRQRSPLVMDEDLRLSEASVYDEPDHYHPFDGPSNSDEESTLSDASSTKNTSIPRFRSPEERIVNHSPPIRYSSPHTHPPLPPYQHYHTPTPPHLSHPHGLLPHPIDYSQHRSGSLTLSPAHSPHSTLVLHSSASPQILSHMGTPPSMLHSNGRSHPIVMPDAYPHGTPEGHRFESSYTGLSFVSDYDTSTCASAELDEQLHFMPDNEPRFISLSTTDVYSYDDDTQL